MEEAAPARRNLIKHFSGGSKFSSLIAVVVIALILGSVSGFFLAGKSSGSKINPPTPGSTPKTAAADSQLCRDFAEGTIKPKDAKDQYSEGTHLLQRDQGLPVALTSSVIDLSQYENKKVKVYGETQKALKEGWLMDVCRVEDAK